MPCFFASSPAWSSFDETMLVGVSHFGLSSDTQHLRILALERWQPFHFTPKKERARRSRSPQDGTVHEHAVHRVRWVVEHSSGGGDILYEARILRAIVTVQEGRDVPCFLIIQAPALAEWHVGLDEACGVLDRGHASTPIERVGSPERGDNGGTVRTLLA